MKSVHRNEMKTMHYLKKYHIQIEILAKYLEKNLVEKKAENIASMSLIEILK